jgi:hypothetical protein
MYLKLWGCHGFDDVRAVVVGCDGVCTCSRVPLFQRNTLRLKCWRSLRSAHVATAHNTAVDIFVCSLHTFYKMNS